MTRYSAMRKRTEALRYSLTCRFCGNKHPIRLCPVFRAKAPEDRLRDVLLHRYCSNCRAGTHRAAHCTNEGRCRRCQESHHTLLHIDDAAEKRTSRRPTRSAANDDDDSDNNKDSDVISIEASEVEEEEVVQTGAETDAFRQILRPEWKRMLSIRITQADRNLGVSDRYYNTSSNDRVGKLQNTDLLPLGREHNPDVGETVRDNMGEWSRTHSTAQ
ncbi:PREDICTED: uncharacterized protein LOC108358308 [Rhagoletis zephyria]|uniref:uncharacterized protein LOC108358308 n=1 Tax=Rhagoletis zephyria TaxID=28612 RepID=UPI0008116542|nr:PREDICTED: uncharacterized protein LOC108358308 [Rhagoletis zephyria]